MRKVIAVFILHCASYMATIRANKADILGEQEEVQFQSLYRQGGQEDDFNRERILDCDSWHGAGGHFPSGLFRRLGWTVESTVWIVHRLPSPGASSPS